MYYWFFIRVWKQWVNVGLQQPNMVGLQLHEDLSLQQQNVVLQQPHTLGGQRQQLPNSVGLQQPSMVSLQQQNNASFLVHAARPS